MRWDPSDGINALIRRQGLPCGPETETPPSQFRGLGSVPGQETKHHVLQLKIQLRPGAVSKYIYS